MTAVDIVVDERGLDALPDALARLGSRRLLLLTGPSGRYLELVQLRLTGAAVDVFAGARRHVPLSALAEARARLDAFGGDTVLALGGGSPIGFGKALRRDREVRFIAVPTTYAGSEMTTLWGTTADGRKTTGRDSRVRPDVVIYDVELTLDMSPVLTVTSLMNALAHPISVLGAGSLSGQAISVALDAAASVYQALEALARDRGDRAARARAQRAAGRAAQVLDAGKPGLHHALAHLLGGRFDLDHGGLHSVLLPHTLRRLRADAPPVYAAIAARLGASEPEVRMLELLRRAGAAPSLRALGVSEEALRATLQGDASLPAALLLDAFEGSLGPPARP